MSTPPNGAAPLGFLYVIVAMIASGFLYAFTTGDITVLVPVGLAVLVSGWALQAMGK